MGMFLKSTPQSAMEIITDIYPLDIHVFKTGLSTYARIQTQLDTPDNGVNTHLKYWHDQYLQAELTDNHDKCLETIEEIKTNINIKSFTGENKYITKAQITLYTDGSKTKDGTGAGFVIVPYPYMDI